MKKREQLPTVQARFDENYREQLHDLAGAEHRPLTNFVESVVMRFLNHDLYTREEVKEMLIRIYKDGENWEDVLSPKPRYPKAWRPTQLEAKVGAAKGSKRGP